MSKRIYIPLLVIIFFSTLVLLAPRVLDIDAVRSKVATVVSAKSGWQIDGAQLDWYWLPSPHFSLLDTTLTRKDALLIIPETRIFPRWRSLLLKKLELRAVELINPELRIESFANHQDQAKITLPQTRITVIDGSVVFSEGLFTEQAHILPLTIAEINATLALASERGDFQVSAKSPHFNFLELEGTFTPADLGFKMAYEINGFKFHKLVPALAAERLLPVESAISLQGTIAGNGTEQFKADMTGDFPCFVAPAATESFLLDCGSADLAISKDEDGFTIDINELQLKNPGLILSGRIAKLTNSSATEDPEPVWLLDLTGKELDLTAIRKGVLTLWGDNHIARTVCDIVLGGKASQATYFFKAPLAGFKSIGQMKIRVDVEEAEIHPPHTPLFLEKARGTIEIVDGYLSGQGLTARLGNSKGENCSLFLDLADRKKEFRLNLDLDADLAALPAVLDDLVPHKGFRRELQRFSDVQGRAAGHLRIGETLDTLKVNVNINSVNGGAKYEPMPPFRIRSGSLDISPDSVKWQGIRGVVGSHMIRELSGEVSWAKGVSLAIKSAQATFDSAALLTELNTASVLPGEINKAITKAEGILELNKATMSGLINKPDKWQYSLDLASSGSRWASPLLPHAILAERVRAKISRNRIELVSGKVWFLEQPLLIEGVFSHKNFTDWQFQTMLSGTIREPLAEWVREKAWIPSRYFPVIPCTLDKLEIQWESDTLKLTGGIAAGMGGITSPSVRLQLETDSDQLIINELIVSSPEEQGHLTLKHQKNAPKRLNVSWQGFIDSETILELLNENILATERLEGDFSAKYSKTLKEQSFTGWAKAHNIAWFADHSRHGLMIRELKLSGEQDGSIKIDHAVIADEDEELNLNGQLAMDPAKITFDLGLDAEKVTRRTTKKIIDDLKGFSPAAAESHVAPKTPAARQLKGVLHFKLGQFTSSPDDEQNGKTASPNYVLSPANGFITIDSATDLASLDLRDSSLCGLNISGTLNAKESSHESSLTIFTDSSAPPLFQDVLPCFGFENTLLDGTIHLDVNLKGTANKWRSGNANLYSDGGYIHRLGFLSKVFRVINLRDIFSGADLPDFANKGFAYSKIDITSHVEDNKLRIDKAFIAGEGLNIFGQGTIDLADWSADLIVMVAPLKTVDAVFTNIPLIGKVLGGKDKAVLSIPVALKGDLRDPDVTILPPEAIGKGLLNLIGNTLMMPFQIFSPLLPDTTQE
ncbi:MAG: AsmA-like C-terminal domain-containing protein [Thermodesulfobacteriota bacterium]